LRPSIRIAFVIIALVAAAAIVIGDFVRRTAARRLREAILAELQPVALKNCTLKRFGSANDGGYLMCENLIEPLDVAYSYGVGRNDDWGCELSRRYHVPVRVGVPDELGEQAHRCARSGGALSGTDEPAERARLGDMAGLSVGHGGGGALKLHGYGSQIFECHPIPSDLKARHEFH
jgi:hypothetical protein